ncbi:MAG: ThiF family adenylyltransferase [Candidatus Jordarchaeaceae archaeon]
MKSECNTLVRSVVFFNFSLDMVRSLGSGSFFGKILDGEVFHIHDMRSVGDSSDLNALGDFRYVSEKNLLTLTFNGCVGILRFHENDLKDAYVIHDSTTADKFMNALSCGDENKINMFFKESAGGEVERLFVDFVSQNNIYSRIRRIVDTDLLKGKRVTVVGLGTGGSRVALELAKAGVGNFALIDYDRLETHNISRYVKGVSDLGRLKVNVVADLLLDINPEIRVSKHPLRIDKYPDEFSKIVNGSDVVVDATGSPLINQFVNSTCWKLGVPSVYAGAFERAIGLYVLSVQPPDTPCYNCVFEDVFSRYTPPKPEFLDYTEVSDPSELRAEPGLSISVGFGALFQAWYVLQILLGKESRIGAIDYQMILWGNRKEWIFKERKIPSLMFVRTERKKDCPVCRESEWIEGAIKEVGITNRELEERLNDEERKLIKEISSNERKNR